jgi:hypothetical protein
MKNLKKTSGSIALGLALILLMAGCVDIIKAPPEVFDPTDGQLVITIGSGLERTVFPRIDQFSKITLSFEKKDGAGSKEDEEVSLGDTLINLTPGTWELTAAAYNNAEPPAVVARAVNTLTRAGDLITGDTYFALAPAGTGLGVLSYKITPPGGIALDAAQSRIRIEQDGVALSSLNSDSFTAGVRPISGAVNGTLSLEPGRYAVDIVLDDSKSVNTAVFRGAAAILPGLVTEIVFSPAAGDFLDPDVRLALSGTAAFNVTARNTSKTSVGLAGGEGANPTRGLSVPRGTETVYFTLGKTAAQTLTLDAGTAEGKIVWTESGNVDGSIASGTKVVFTVDTGDLAENGGDRVFNISLAEPGKAPLTYTVTVAVPYLAKIVIDKFPERLLFVEGTSLDLTGIQLTGTWSDLTKTLLTVSEVDISGFDTNQIGEQYIRASKNNVISDNGFTITVIKRMSRLFFDHGLTNEYDPSPYQYYTVPNGRTVVLAPVQWLIPDNAVYEWKVDDSVQGENSEYFSYTGTASSGTHTITVTAKVDGVPLASAVTTVVNTGGAAKREKNAQSGALSEKLYSVVAPGQFGSTSQRLGDLHGFGGFGGHAVFQFDHSVEKKGTDGEEILIGGNAFGVWNEPGAIWVSQDDNNNGEPDDTWYELKGSHTLVPETLRRNAVTFLKGTPVMWVDNLGNTGTYVSLQKWPTEVPAGLTEFTLVGTCLDISATYDSSIAGYADVFDNGRVSLSNAIQADGSSVDLPFIDFVKIVTAFNYGDSIFGERSTEANTPTDRTMPDPSKRITGKDLGDNTYEYSFVNNSGYPLTVEFDGAEFSLAVGDTVVKTSENAAEYIDCYGGNVSLAKSTGKVIFTDA